MLKSRITQVGRWFLVAVFAAGSGAALAQAEQQKLIDAADASFSNFVRDPDMTWIQQNVGRAKGCADCS